MPDNTNGNSSNWQKKYLDDLNEKLKSNKQNNLNSSNQSGQSQSQNQSQNQNKKPVTPPARDNRDNRNQRQDHKKQDQRRPDFKKQDPKKQDFRRDRDRNRNRDQRGGRDDRRSQEQRNVPKPPQPPRVRNFNGIVTAIREKQYSVWAERKEWICGVQDAVIKQGPLYIGDKVRIAVGNDNQATIDKYEPRQNVVLAPGKNATTALSANVNQILLVVAVKEPVLRTDWLDRHLLICERKGFKPIIVCHKIDLAEDNSFLEQMETYKRMGYRVIHTSSAILTSLAELKSLTKNKTTLLAGHLGVGKTTLTELLLEPENERLPDNPEDYDLTIVDDYVESTTAVAMHRIPEGGFLVDTPGVLEYDVTGLEKKDVKKYFRDFRNYNHQCSMPECNHADEPNCKVTRAVEFGDISVDRYQNYLKILESIPS